MVLKIQILKFGNFLIRFFTFILIAATIYCFVNYFNQHDRRPISSEELTILENIRKMELFRENGIRLNDETIQSAFSCLFSNFQEALDDIKEKSFDMVYNALDELVNVITV